MTRSAVFPPSRFYSFFSSRIKKGLWTGLPAIDELIEMLESARQHEVLLDNRIRVEAFQVVIQVKSAFRKSMLLFDLLLVLPG